MVALDLQAMEQVRQVGNMAFLSTKLPWELAQTKWASTLNPVLSIPMLSGVQISNIKLTASTPLAINHLLQRMPQGWFLTDNNSNAVIWRTQPFNNLTITLESSANTTISFWIY